MKHDKVCGFLIIECSISDAQWCSTFLYDLMLSYYFSLKFLPSRTPLAHFFCACSLGYFYFDGGFPLYLVNLNVNDMLMVVSTGMRGHRVPSWRKWSWKSLVLSHYFFYRWGLPKFNVLARTILRSKAPPATKPAKGMSDVKEKGTKKRKGKKGEEDEAAGSNDPKPKQKAKRTRK